MTDAPKTPESQIMKFPNNELTMPPLNLEFGKNRKVSFAIEAPKTPESQIVKFPNDDLKIPPLNTEFYRKRRACVAFGE